jgi:hypothetical protein
MCVALGILILATSGKFNSSSSNRCDITSMFGADDLLLSALNPFCKAQSRRLRSQRTGRPAMRAPRTPTFLALSHQPSANRKLFPLTGRPARTHDAFQRARCEAAHLHRKRCSAMDAKTSIRRSRWQRYH